MSNHLNDISRDHPGLAMEIAAKWRTDADTTTDRVVRHGLRTLIKAGHPETLTLLGHSPDVPVTVDGPRVSTPRARPHFTGRPLNPPGRLGPMTHGIEHHPAR
ncbi:hypothetical protein [Streptomyces sp. H27-H5]|uniref:hypothetical protein n=1 Tax=Streptomyces sp. H27-H5 TaxID=2996460 RepID=UPI00226DB2AA|nr:hypothetical protein [Streptomyces sp. H27-H5]MCY0958010.1 hypothetical protein [Streptomyces sp. H27-H5]